MIRISGMTRDDLRKLADSMSVLDTVDVVAEDRIATQFQHDLGLIVKPAMRWGVVDR